jgi:hypothetical protein
MNDKELAEMAASKRIVSKPGAVIQAYTVKIPERIQRLISEAIQKGKR